MHFFTAKTGGYLWPDTFVSTCVYFITLFVCKRFVIPPCRYNECDISAFGMCGGLNGPINEREILLVLSCSLSLSFIHTHTLSSFVHPRGSEVYYIRHLLDRILVPSPFHRSRPYHRPVLSVGPICLGWFIIHNTDRTEPARLCNRNTLLESRPLWAANTISLFL